jgi:FtsH-binding integral membrane protein
MSDTFVAHPVAKAAPAQRAAFIRNIYLHFIGALLAFLLLAAVAVQLGVLEMLTDSVLGDLAENPSRGRRGGQMRIGMLGMIVAFMSVPAWIADSWGKSALPSALHYGGLAIYLVIDVFVMTPALVALVWAGGPSALFSAALMTVFLILGALLVVLLTDKDYDLVKIIFCLAGSVMLGMLATAVLFGASLGTLLFSLMQFYAVGALVIRTSRLMDETEPQQYVGASLSLFASMPLLLPMFFVYLVRLTPGTKDLATAQSEFSTASRYSDRDMSPNEEASRRREKEFAEYVARQMANGRKR